MTALLLALTLSASAQTLPDFERILLPVVARRPIPGAHGSLWETVVTLRNACDQTLIYFPTDCPLVPPIPERFCAQDTSPQLLPGVTRRVDLLTQGAVFLNVTKSLADCTFVQLRVHDLSRQGESFGTEIPVIRVADMKTGLGEILDIPRDSRFRLTFRLYADVVDRETKILVRFVNETTAQNRELFYSVLPLPASVPVGEPITSPPLYSEISGFEFYPELQDGDRIRIEIDPQNQNVKYWAFVSVTNNETQQITTLTVH